MHQFIPQTHNVYKLQQNRIVRCILPIFIFSAYHKLGFFHIPGRQIVPVKRHHTSILWFLITTPLYS